MRSHFAAVSVPPELSIPATGQKDRGLWGREWLQISLPSPLEVIFIFMGEETKIAHASTKANIIPKKTHNFQV